MATNSTPDVGESQVKRIAELVHRLELIPDKESREVCEQLMQAVLDLHGAGIERMMELVFESDSAGETTMRRFANDSLVSSLLILHNLHPEDLETRVQKVLAKVQGRVELVGVLDGVVRIRMYGGDEEALKSVLREAIPDVADIVVQHSPLTNGFVPLRGIDGVALSAG